MDSALVNPLPRHDKELQSMQFKVIIFEHEEVAKSYGLFFYIFFLRSLQLLARHSNGLKDLKDAVDQPDFHLLHVFK